MRIVITSSWGEKCTDVQDLQSRLESFPFKDRVIDAITFRGSDNHFLKESEKIRQWLLNNHEKWDIKSVLVVGSFQLQHRFSHVPLIFSTGAEHKVPCTGYGYAFSDKDIEPALEILTTESFSPNSLESWSPIKDCALV